jgi:hypothetical protein
MGIEKFPREPLPAGQSIEAGFRSGCSKLPPRFHLYFLLVLLDALQIISFDRRIITPSQGSKSHWPPEKRP